MADIDHTAVEVTASAWPGPYLEYLGSSVSRQDCAQPGVGSLGIPSVDELGFGSLEPYLRALHLRGLCIEDLLVGTASAVAGNRHCCCCC